LTPLRGEKLGVGARQRWVNFREQKRVRFRERWGLPFPCTKISNVRPRFRLQWAYPSPS